jgi:glycosyltransferase involved in cell wall biosynthesis
MRSTPRVTFLLPVHNATATVAATIESILAQSLSDFELLILDDASTDTTVQVIGGYGDRRIRVEANPIRLQLPETLNRGLALARAEYVARIDGDDLCLPHRAAVQADYLDGHPDIAVLGSYFETFSDDPAEGGGQIVTPPLDSATISVTLLLRNTLAHPSVMLRKSALAANGLWYDSSAVCGEDYDLWARCAMRRLALANVPEVLVRYRLHAKQVTQLNASTVRATAAAIRQRLIEHLGLRPDPATLAVHEAIGLDEFLAEAPFICAAAKWLTALANANESRRCFDHQALMRLLTGRYVSLGRFAKRNHLLPPDIGASPFASYLHPGVLV